MASLHSSPFWPSWTHNTKDPITVKTRMQLKVLLPHSTLSSKSHPFRNSQSNPFEITNFLKAKQFSRNPPFLFSIFCNCVVHQISDIFTLKIDFFGSGAKKALALWGRRQPCGHAQPRAWGPLLNPATSAEATIAAHQ